MIWKILSFNGFSLSAPTYWASFDNRDKPQMQPSVRTSSVTRLGSAPAPGSHFRETDYFVVTVLFENGDQQAAHESLVQNVRTVDPVLYQLIAEDTSKKRWYVLARPIMHTREKGRSKITFEVFDAIWRSYAENTDSWSITASGDTHDIVVAGNQDTYPVYEATPTTTPSGIYQYRQYVKNYNPIPRYQTDAPDLTTGGWNTAALVSGGKMQSLGQDCRVIVDGAEVPRWFGGGGINNAATKVFCRIAWKPGQFLKLLTAVSNVGTPTTLAFEKTAASSQALKALQNRGILRLDNEEFSYSEKSLSNYTVTVSTRSIRGTAAASHSAGITVYWVEHDIQIIYGNSSVAAPVYSDVYKPVYNLTSSTNTSRVYDDFADTDNLRAGRWQRQLLSRQGKVSRVYSGNQGAEADVNPVTDMGMEVAAYQADGRWKPDTAALAWVLEHPAGIATVDASGEKYKKASTTLWPGVAALESSVDGGKTWVQERNEAAPGSAATWTAWSFSGEAIASGALAIRFRLFGSVNGIANNVARYEVNSVTVVLTSANVIQLGLNGEEASYLFSIRIENVTTGEWIEITYPVAQGKTLVIDTENLEINYLGVNAIRSIAFPNSRAEWLKLKGGVTNQLKYTASPTGNVTLVTKWRDRSA